MHLETSDFPSDREGQMGDLYTALNRVLQRASESSDVAQLLTDVLKFSTAQLKIAKLDYKTVLAHRKRVEDKRIAAEVEAQRILDEARYGTVSDEIIELTSEQAALADTLGKGTDELTED